MIDYIVRLVTSMFESSSDPVKNCNLYKQIGCAHVDGYLCDMKTCSARKEFDEMCEKKIDCEKGSK